MSAPPDLFAGKTRTRTVFSSRRALPGRDALFSRGAFLGRKTLLGRGALLGRRALSGRCVLMAFALGIVIPVLAQSESLPAQTLTEERSFSEKRLEASPADGVIAPASEALPGIDLVHRTTELAVLPDAEVQSSELQDSEPQSSEMDGGTASEGGLTNTAVAASPNDEPAPSQVREESALAEAEAAPADTETVPEAEGRLTEAASPAQVGADTLSLSTDAVETAELAQLEEPSADKEPSAQEEPPANQEPSANKEPATPASPEASETAAPAEAGSAEPESAEPEKAPPAVANSELVVPTLPRARNIDLTEPVVGELQSEVEVLSADAPAEVDIAAGEELVLLGARVQPGTTTRLSWSPHDAFEGISVPTPVLVVNGAKPGPVLCLTGAVHGDELNGIEVIRRVLYDLNAADVSGTVIGVPIVNQLGFRRNSRYLPDRRDLNRYFPGTPDGSSAARIAYSFFQDIVVNCDMLVDVHTGSFHRTNLPQLRADLNNPAVAEFARAFGDMVVLHGEGQPGTLRREAVEIGIPAVTVEAGEPMRIQEDAVADGVKGIRTLMTSLGMSSRPFFWSRPRPAYYHSYWVRAARGGLLMSSVQLGAQVREGDVLGVVINPITNEQSDVVAPFTGKVIGMALNQVVMPGFAAYHVGIQASEEEMRQATDPGAAHAPDQAPDQVSEPVSGQPGDEPVEMPLDGDGYESELPPEAQPDAPDHREE